jgi:peroxiredoxin
MDVLVLGSRLVLAAVLGVAGLAKLFDVSGTRRAIAEFGVSPALARPLAWALPLAELAIAGALLVRAATWWGALGALALLLLFTVVVTRALARGQQPSCGCFGQLTPSPVGSWTLARNAALLAMAGLVLAQDRPGAGVEDWLASVPPEGRSAVVLSAIAVGLLVVVVSIGIRLLGQQARIVERLEALEDRLESRPAAGAEREEARPPGKGLPIGAPAPSFELPDLDGIPHSLTSLREPGRPVVLVFVGLDCDPCRTLTPELAQSQREQAAVLDVVLVSSGDPAQNRATFGSVPRPLVLLQAGSAVAEAYAADWMPAAVLVGRDGRLWSAVVFGDEAIRTLVSRAASMRDRWVVDAPPDTRAGRGLLSLVRRGPARLGDTAPPLRRNDLDGRPVDLADYRGRETLVVFWQPECPHCKSLSEDLRRWEVEPPRGAPRLLVVSSGSVEANRDLRLRSSVVLDEGFQLGKAFGVRGTPSAVLVDADGRIASTVGVGARDVLALAGGVPGARIVGDAPPLR